MKLTVRYSSRNHSSFCNCLCALSLTRLRCHQSVTINHQAIHLLNIRCLYTQYNRSKRYCYKLSIFHCIILQQPRKSFQILEYCLSDVTSKLENTQLVTIKTTISIVHYTSIAYGANKPPIVS